MRIARRLTMLLLLASGACTMPNFQWPVTWGEKSDPAAREACSSVCSKYFQCKGSQDQQALDECVATCNPQSVEPDRVASLQAMSCDTFVATVEGRGAEASGPKDAPGAGGGALAGVWVAEENSLDPQFYMSFTQYLTFYPDGSVGYAKAEGGVSVTRINENWVRFRSFHEGQRPPNVVGRWSSDGGQVRVQFASKTAQGRVRGTDEIALSRMGVLEEGATLVFKRRR